MKFTDEELRKLTFNLSDPYSQDGLVRFIPEGADLVRIINTYKFERYPREKAWCAKCRRRAHKKGFTAELSDGALVMLGSACGRKVFKRAWADAEDDFKDERKRASYLDWFDDIRPKLAGIGSGALAWRSPALQMKKNLDRFETALPDLFAALKRAASRGGELKVHRKIDAKERAKWHGGRDAEYVELVYHRLTGGEFLLIGDPEEIVADAEKTVRMLAAACANLANYSTTQLQRLSVRYSNMVDSLRRLHDAHGAAFVFFDPKQMDRIASWATEVPQIEGEYRFNVDTLVCPSLGKAMRLMGLGRELDNTLPAILWKAA